jgi:TorA maturation chaperone TorD
MTERADLFRSLAALCEAPQPEHVRLAELFGWEAPSGVDFASLFVLQVYPYASVHVGAEGMLGGEARDRVAGFWRALHLAPPAEPDHLAALLGMYAALIDAEADETEPARAAMRREARRALLWEHLLSWLMVFTARVEELGSTTYRSWARLLRETLLAEASELGPAKRLPLHLRVAIGLPVDGAPAGEWISALLAPVRSGMLLTRADLVRAARSTGLGLRIGERAFILRALFEQEPTATAAWLTEEAEAWRDRHAAIPELGDVGRFWAERAEAAAARLREVITARNREGVEHGTVGATVGR